MNNEPIHDLIDAADTLVELVNGRAGQDQLAEQVVKTRAAVRAARSCIDPEDEPGPDAHLEADYEDRSGDPDF